jgi:hypothetical protein
MNKNLIARIVTVVVVTLAGAALAWADEGKIPLFEPTTITEPGHYIVTRDISSATGPIFDIQADNVRLDLGGHRLSLSDTTTDVIKITNGSEKGIIIIDGRIHGGRNGVARMTQPLDKILLTLVDVRIVDPAENGIIVDNLGMLEARGVSIVCDCTAMDLKGGTPGTDLGTARIVGAHIQANRGIVAEVVAAFIHESEVNTSGTGVTLTDSPGSSVTCVDFVHPAWRSGFQPQPEPPGIWITDSSGSSIRDNVFRGTVRMGISPSPFIELAGSKGIIIVDNKIHGAEASASGNYGISADASSIDVLIQGNAITGCGDDGIHVLSRGNSIRDNLVNGNEGHGIFVGGTNNLVERNRIGHNDGDGIFFDNGNGPHIYLNNILRGNLGSAVGGSMENTDAGGNVL